MLGLAILFVASIMLSPHDRREGFNIFLSTGNLTDILRQVSEIGIVALAMTFVILTAGIDLSVGSLLALGASVGPNARQLPDWETYCRRLLGSRCLVMPRTRGHLTGKHCDTIAASIGTLY